MVRRVLFSLLVFSAFCGPIPLRAADLVGLHGQWGAFRASGGTKCYATRLPEQDEGSGAYLSIVVGPGGAARFYAKLGRDRAVTSDASTSVGGRRFSLSGKGKDLYAQDTRMDRAIIAAIRSARALSVEAVGRDGQAIVYGYDLKGAASAIDAARLACRKK